MPPTPVRVAVVSHSTVIRAGLVGLVEQAGVVVVPLDPSSLGAAPDWDVVVYDLVSVRDLTAYADLRLLGSAGVPVIGLTDHHRQPTGGPDGLGEPLTTTVVPLDVTAEDLRAIVETLSTARVWRHRLLTR